MYFNHAYPPGLASRNSNVRFNCTDEVHYYPGALHQILVGTALAPAEDEDMINQPGP